jgi:L-threonylcarbamoyladenylate synthase
MLHSRHTLLRQISAQQPEPAIIAEAAEILRRGGLVALPTETVYGLGANALDAVAVQSIFDAKGRSANNPIIVHVADAAAAKNLVSAWPEKATVLSNRFWPGPLTLVLPKRPIVPAVVTAGGATVGLRVPAHPVALALLKAAGVPIAAPSANRSSRVSPTTASHVLGDLEGRIDMVLDAGPTSGGLESTVLDLTADPPCVLRPGLVTVAQLEAVIGHVDAQRHRRPTSTQAADASTGTLRSPGMLNKHYSPRARVICVAVATTAPIDELLETGQRVGWLRLTGNSPKPSNDQQHKLIVIDMPSDVVNYSARLYAAFHELDDAQVDCIVVDMPPAGDEWLAVHDRLRRAAQAE